LINNALPIITGFSSISENLPAKVLNRAGEFTINTVNIKSKSFTWSTTLNFTIPQNKLLSYSGVLPSNLVIGQPLSIRKVYHFMGVNPASGKYYFSSAQGTLTSTPNFLKDANQLANTNFPEYYGGLKNVFRYKDFQLDVMLTVTNKTAANYFFGTLIPGFKSVNEPMYVLSRWQKSGDVTNVQKFNSTGSLIPQFLDALESDAAYSKVSYIRLKNLSFSWSAPYRLIQRMNVQGFRLFVQGENLVTLTNFKGLDPETGNSALPPLRTLTAGLQLGL
jgi:hypothetical protein